MRKPFPVLQLHTLPRWIAENDIEAAVPAAELVLRFLASGRHLKDISERQMPVEELVLPGEAFDFVAHPLGCVMWVALQAAEDFVGDGKVKATHLTPALSPLGGRRGRFLRRAFDPDEGSTPGVGQLASELVAGGADEFGVFLFLSLHVFEAVVGQAGDLGDVRGEVAEMFPRFVGRGEELELRGFLAVGGEIETSRNAK